MAASTRIVYIPTAIGGQELANAARYTIRALQAINRAKDMAAAISGAGVASQNNLEGSAEFGAAAGQGATLYSAIVSLQSGLAAISPSLLANLDQGG